MLRNLKCGFVHQLFCRSLLMEGKKKAVHVYRTASSLHAKRTSKAKVQSLNDISKTVKKITLAVDDNDFTFKAGQWVDFIVPGIDVVGNFNMCSSPQKLQSQGLMDLAIKFSAHPPAFWVHKKAIPGSEVEIKVGGDFFYESSLNTDKHGLLLIAGGVGINPLMSIMNYIADHGEQQPKVHLMYSSATKDELLFQNDILDLCAKNSNMNCSFHVTQEDDSAENHSKIPIKYGRITSENLEDSLSFTSEQRGGILCYICGPGRMMETVEEKLFELNIPKEHIIFEKWW